MVAAVSRAWDSETEKQEQDWASSFSASFNLYDEKWFMLFDSTVSCKRWKMSGETEGTVNSTV